MSKSIVAVSGGPDSMALLDYLETNHVDYIVCHVNYHHRETSDRDEGIVSRWCEEHNRPLYINEPVYETGNFEAWARDARYKFFEEVARETGADILYVGHNEDDAIETWMIQKERGAIPEYYGIKAISHRRSGNLLVVRPLLNKTKAELEQLCNDKGIEWGLDETNLSDDYTRNKIRHHIVAPASKEQRAEWLKAMALDNKNLYERRQHAEKLLKTKDANRVLTDDDAWFILERLYHRETGKHKTMRSMKEAIRSLTSTGKADGIIIQNNWFTFIKPTLNNWHEETIQDIETLDQYTKEGKQFGYFQLSTTGKQVDTFYIQETDFPITITCAKDKDEVNMVYGTKKVSKILRDRKIPKDERRLYPLIKNRKGEIIFVASSGCSKSNYQSGTAYFLIKS